MDDYFVTLSGSFSLPKANDAIVGEEAGASEFMDSHVQYVDSKLTNLVRFKILEPGTIPPIPELQRHDDPAPPGKNLKWVGVMLLGGTMTPVKLYR